MNTPLRLMSKVFSTRSSGMSRKRSMNEIPALLTQASRPRRSATSSATLAAPTGSVTSSCRYSWCWPAAVSSCSAQALAACSSTSVTTTCQPRRANSVTMALPMPDAAPVTTTVFVNALPSLTVIDGPSRSLVRDPHVDALLSGGLQYRAVVRTVRHDRVHRAQWRDVDQLDASELAGIDSEDDAVG